jgi:transposase
MDVVLEMPYSLDLRDRAVAAVHSGMQKTKVCNLFTICRQTLYSWLALENEQGHLAPKIGFQKGHSHGIKDLEKFRAFVDSHPDYTQEEMALHYSVGSSTIGRAMAKIGYSRKKRAKHTPKGVTKNDELI